MPPSSGGSGPHSRPQHIQGRNTFKAPIVIIIIIIVIVIVIVIIIIVIVGAQKIYTSTALAGSCDPVSMGTLIENASWEPAGAVGGVYLSAPEWTQTR